MARKIIHIAPDSGSTLFALCDDGTIWRKENVGQQILHQPDQSEQPWIEIENVAQLLFPVHITASSYVALTYEFH